VPGSDGVKLCTSRASVQKFRPLVPFLQVMADSGDHFWGCDTFFKYRLQLADFQKFHWFPSYDILTCVGSINGGEAW
jgi:hypothetical protein